MFKKNSSQSYNYTPSPEEKALLAQQLKYQEAFFPNVIELNNKAGDVLWDSFGTVQADFKGMNDAAQKQIANAQGTIGDLQQGKLPAEYQQNFVNSMQRGVDNTVGNAINNLGQRGVLNSSVTGGAMNDISKNVADAAANNFNQNMATQSQLAQQQIDNATSNITAAAGAQEAAQNPALNLWNASIGLQGTGNQVLGNIAGKYGTGVTTQSGGGGFGNFLGNAAGNWLGNSGMVGRKW